MKGFSTIVYMLFLCCLSAQAQKLYIKGKVISSITTENLSEVKIKLIKSHFETYTDSKGEFVLDCGLFSLGEHIVEVSKIGYITKRFPITSNKEKSIVLSTISLDKDFSQDQGDIATISLFDEDLDDTEFTNTVSGLLQANRDTFLAAAAFDFSATFFRPRGLGNENGKVLINGVEMNKVYNRKPQWSNWGGLNDVTRNQTFASGLSNNKYAFGDLLGVANISTRASEYGEGGRISYATSNRSYRGRVMGTYTSGLSTSGWAYALSLSRRYGNEGFVDGTLYDSNSVFGAVEKKLGKNHSINLTGIYAPNRRGRSTAITKEVYDIKGNTYNPNWGFQNGKIRNSRTLKIE